MPELGECAEPTELVPGDYSALQTAVSQLGSYGDVLHSAGAGLGRVDTAAGWSGQAADRFRDVFHGQPKTWLQAGDSFHAASTAVDNYSATLLWAQGRAADAVRQWNQAQAATTTAQQAHEKNPGTPFNDPGAAGRTAAQDTLNRARQQLASAGGTAAGIVSKATAAAPPEPSLLSRVVSGITDTAGEVGQVLENAGKDMINDAASLGSAALNHPGQALLAGAGVGLTAVSGVGEGVGGLLDLTGIGTAGGLAINGAATAGVAAGVGITGSAIGAMAVEGAGEDHVQVFNTDNSGADSPGEDPPFEPPKEITGYRGHARERMFENSRGDGGVTDEAARNAIENPVKPPEFQADEKGGKYLFRGKDANIVLNRDGEVVSAWPKSSAGRRFPK